MARKRTKSVNQIMSQFNSIAERSLVQDANRVSRARRAAYRYYDNIRNSVGNWNNNDDRLFNRQFSRSTYMGLSNG